jgi:HK97 family phage portal protein
MSIDTLIKRLEAAYDTSSGVSVTPDNCEQAPTVKAIITAVTRRFAVMPVHVYQKTTSEGRDSKEILPNHPVEKLLNMPNEWQTRSSYWMDAASALLRYGNFYAFTARGVTGPIRRLLPLDPGQTIPRQDEAWNVVYETTLPGGRRVEYQPRLVHHARTASRDFLKGNSPVIDLRETIALEIAAERMGAALFGNGALPGLVFKYSDNSQGHKTAEERNEFLEDIKRAYTGKGRFKAMLLPKGIDLGDPIAVENDKAQFLQLRQYQRTVIAGAWGCPPHLVGDLSKGTFNNVEMQGIEFTTNLVLPYVRVFETAMERDLLTQDDRNSGVIIRFNPDAILRGDFKSRQEGLAIQRQNGIINANEWREHEGMNPRVDDGGEAYFETGPSGQTPTGTGNQQTNDNQNQQDQGNESGTA